MSLLLIVRHNRQAATLQALRHQKNVGNLLPSAQDPMRYEIWQYEIWRSQRCAWRSTTTVLNSWGSSWPELDFHWIFYRCVTQTLVCNGLPMLIIYIYISFIFNCGAVAAICPVFILSWARRHYIVWRFAGIRWCWNHYLRLWRFPPFSLLGYGRVLNLDCSKSTLSVWRHVPMTIWCGCW